MQGFLRQEKGRCDCYKLLAVCFYPPQKELFSNESLVQNLAAALAVVHREATLFTGRMERAFDRYSEEELAVEHARLFVGPHELQAPPYGSVYLDQGRRVMGNSTISILERYAEEGLTLSDDFDELPDHAAVELEFMYYLACREVGGLERSEMDVAVTALKAQERFLHEHLGRWIQTFCGRLREHTENEWYAALAECTASFISRELSSSLIPTALETATAEV